MNTPAPFLPSDTLVGVLSRIKAGERGEDDPALQARINTAFAKHHDRLLRLVRAELRGFSEEQVEDTVQESLAIAWRKLATHDGRSFRAWLFMIATNECSNLQKKKRDVLAGDDALFEAAADVESSYERLRREERERLFREAAEHVLNAQEHEVVHMRYELDLPREEVARLAGLDDPDEVRVILQRARRLLVKELDRRLKLLGHGTSLLREG